MKRRASILAALALAITCQAPPISAQESASADSFDLTGLEPEAQTPSGKFTTAAEVAPILKMTTANWVAVREYNGKDLVYFSHIFSWRCGLLGAKVSINEEPLRDLEMPDCHMKYQQPNSILNDEALMTFQSYDLGSVNSVRVDLLLDDLTVQSATLLRENILIP